MPEATIGLVAAVLAVTWCVCVYIEHHHQKYFVNAPFKHFYKCNKHCKFSVLANVSYSQESYEEKIFFLLAKTKDFKSKLILRQIFDLRSKNFVCFR